MPAPAAAAFGTVLTAMVTPFTADGELDLDSAQQLATHLVDSGNDGLVISGTTGESATTTDSEKEQLLRAVVEAVGDRARVVAGAGTNDTRHTVELARAAEKAGAHALLIVTPYYNKPPQDGLARHFQTAADATDLPVMLYDIPGRTGTPISTETLLRLAEHDRILAVKDAKGDLSAGSEVMAATDLAFYSGDDANNLPWLALGAVGVVSVVAHVAAREYAEMVRAVERSDLPTAQRLHRQLLLVVRAVMNPRLQGAMTSKAALHAFGRISTRVTRPPLVDLSDEQSADLVAQLAAAGIAR